MRSNKPPAIYTLGKEEIFFPPYFDQVRRVPASVQATVDATLQSTDEAAVWRLMDAHQGNDDVLSYITDCIFRCRSPATSGLGLQHSELFMVPVVCNYIDQLGADNPSWLQVASGLNRTLHASFESGIGLALFQGVAPFDKIAAYTPSVWQAHLCRATSREQQICSTYTASEIQLPDDAPRLGFIMLAGIRTQRWPDLPARESHSNARTRSIVQHLLAMVVPDSFDAHNAPPAVIAPQRAPLAIADGINLWLHALHEKIGILGYLVQPSTQAMDVTKITLKLDGNPPSLSQFIIRTHQIGPQGVADVLSTLENLANNLERAEDFEGKVH